MNTELHVEEIDTIPSRRVFVKMASVLAAGLTGASLLATSFRADASPPREFKHVPYPRFLNLPAGADLGFDVRVLNYALMLEDLETDLYVQALYRLTNGGTNELGTKITGLGLAQTEPDVTYLTEFGKVEHAHQSFIRGSLHHILPGIAIGKFKYAFGVESMSRQEVVDLVLDAEATGVQAYLGAIPHFGTKDFLTPAAAILGTEARHTAVIKIIRTNLFGEGGPGVVAPMAQDNHGADTPMTPDDVLAKVSKYIV